MLKLIFKHFRKKESSRAYSLVEAAISLAVLGIIAGTFFDINNFKSGVENIKSIRKQTAQIEQAIDIYVAKNGHLPCPARRTDLRDTATFGVATDCTAAAPAGTVETGTGVDIVRLGVLPVRSLDLPDTMMFDPWSNRISYSVVRDLAQNSTNYDNYSTASADVIRINDSNGNRINRANAVGDETIVSWVAVSHGKDGRGAYSMEAVQKPCSAALDQENCDDDNIFIDSTYDPNPTNAFDDYLIWKTKSQQSFDKHVFITPGSNSNPAQCEEIFNVDEFTPTDLDGLRLWLDAKDASTLFTNNTCTNQASDGDNVYCWKDKSSNNYSATHPTSSNSKAPNWYEGSNNASYVKFNREYFKIEGSPNGAIFPSGASIDEMEFFNVHSLTSSSAGLVFNFVSGSNINFTPYFLGYASWRFNSYLSSNSTSASYDTNQNLWNCLADYEASSKEHKCWKNDQSVINSTNNGPAIDLGTKDLYIGCDSAWRIFCQRMHFNELIIFDRKLTDDEREKVKAYLKKKWDL